MRERERERERERKGQIPNSHLLSKTKRGKSSLDLSFFFLFVCFTPFYMSVCSSACIFHNPQHPSHYTFVVSIVKI